MYKTDRFYMIVSKLSNLQRPNNANENNNRLPSILWIIDQLVFGKHPISKEKETFGQLWTYGNIWRNQNGKFKKENRKIELQILEASTL